MINIERFKKDFIKVKNMGAIKSNRIGHTGIGKTLEDALSIVENNHEAPDLHGIEVKSQRNLTNSYLTLFTKAPTWPKRINSELRIKYGTPDREYTDVKVLHASIFSQRFTDHHSGYSFKLVCNSQSEKIYLIVKNTKTNEILENNIYWTYEVIKNIFNNKLKHLAFISAETHKSNNVEYFRFDRCKLYMYSNFNNFIKQLEKGNIMFDLRIGAYKTGHKKGKTHDHGSGFRIKRDNISNLFNEYVEL